MKPHPSRDVVASYWTDPAQVDSFANRAPDRRLLQLLGSYAEPSSVRVLDLGCAGGRNTVLLAGRGFDFQALDASRPMVARTRERVTEILGVTAARKRVRTGVMNDLGVFADESFDLVVALGIYQQAASMDIWHRAVAESGRVLENGGLLLVSDYTPDSEPEGEPLKPLQDGPDMYEGFSTGPLCLLGAKDYEGNMAAHGFQPYVPTDTVKVDTNRGYRVTLNGLFRKRAPETHTASS